MFKKLLLFWLFSGSLDSFSQVNSDTLLNKVDALIARCKKMCAEMDAYEKNNPWLTGEAINPQKPDTLRAILLVTLRENGPAVARMGFVVISEGKRPVYLDCRKKALKLPMVGWGYVEVGGERK